MVKVTKSVYNFQKDF